MIFNAGALRDIKQQMLNISARDIAGFAQGVGGAVGDALATPFEAFSACSAPVDSLTPATPAATPERIEVTQDDRDLAELLHESARGMRFDVVVSMPGDVAGTHDADEVVGRTLVWHVPLSGAATKTVGAETTGSGAPAALPPAGADLGTIDGSDGDGGALPGDEDGEAGAAGGGGPASAVAGTEGSGGDGSGEGGGRPGSFVASDEGGVAGIVLSGVAQPPEPRRAATGAAVAAAAVALTTLLPALLAGASGAASTAAGAVGAGAGAAGAAPAAGGDELEGEGEGEPPGAGERTFQPVDSPNTQQKPPEAPALQPGVDPADPGVMDPAAAPPPRVEAMGPDSPELQPGVDAADPGVMDPAAPVAPPPAAGEPVAGPVNAQVAGSWNELGADGIGRIVDANGNHILNIDAEGNLTDLAGRPVQAATHDVALRVDGYIDANGRSISFGADGNPIEARVTEFTNPITGEPSPSTIFHPADDVPGAVEMRPNLDGAAATRWSAVRAGPDGEIYGNDGRIVARIDTDGVARTLDGRVITGFGEPTAGRIPSFTTEDGRVWQTGAPGSAPPGGPTGPPAESSGVGVNDPELADLVREARATDDAQRASTRVGADGGADAPGTDAPDATRAGADAGGEPATGGGDATRAGGADAADAADPGVMDPAGAPPPRVEAMGPDSPELQPGVAR